jgi:thioredoxin-related protein
MIKKRAAGFKTDLRQSILILFFAIPALTGHSQALDGSVYDPKADATIDISNAVKKAKAENKFVLIQAGGNWCRWCIEFNRFTRVQMPIDSLLGKSFIVYHLNYSPENTNAKTFASLGFPQRFGFPVFIILDGNGNRLHTQNSEYLEQGNSYNKQKVYEFLSQWTPTAMDPSQYK